MKHWLKHTYGYLNIDEHAVYLTRSGNWSETAKLNEKNYSDFKQHDRAQKIKIAAFLVIVGGILTWLFLKNILSGNISFALIIGIPLLFAFTYKYLIPEYGSAYRIPKHKITSFVMDGNEAHIHFRDANDRETNVRFTGIDQKGIEILKREFAAFQSQM